MKKSILTIAIIAIIVSNFNYKVKAQTKEDSVAIKTACLDYLEGWYTGDANRMEKALHTNLVKRRIVVLKQTGSNLINQVTASDMIEYTKAGFGKQQAKEGMKNEIEILHIYKGIATVNATSKDYVDYIHLGKFNGEWKIINVLWEIRK